MSELPASPRVLHPKVEVGLRWGTGFLSTGLFGVLSVLLGLLWQSLLYGLGPLSYYRTHTEVVTLKAEVARVEMAGLPSGKALAAIAPVKVNDTLIEARGYGPGIESVKPGDAVTVVIPTRSPHQAYLLEFQQTPIPLSTLVAVASGFFGPCFALVVYAFLRSRRILKLLREGSVDKARPLRQLSLPRPFNDKKLGRWESEGKKFWAVTPANKDHLTFLKTARQRGFLESYLTEWEIREQKLYSDPLQTRLQVVLNKGQVVGLALLMLAFLLT